MWSIGAILELDDRWKLEIFMREKVDLDLPVIQEDSGHTIFEYFVSDSGKPLFNDLRCSSCFLFRFKHMCSLEDRQVFHSSIFPKNSYTVSGAVVTLLSMRNLNTGVVSWNPARAIIKMPLVRNATGNHLIKVTFP